jgi:hypothetical protein
MGDASLRDGLFSLLRGTEPGNLARAAMGARRALHSIGGPEER